VFLNTYADGLQADVFNFDNHAGSEALTEHLLGLGHERIAFVHGPPQTRDAHERARGYRDAMGAAGFSTEGLEVPGGYTREAGYAAATRLLAFPQRPTAIVAVNDYCGFGVMSALHHAGVSVPDEISVCGFDGLASTQYSVPPLTTVRVPVRALGHRAIERLADRLDPDGTAGPLASEVIPVELVVRASTAPPPEA
jgi:DNA-binding LacI/PurR family transcriptional regulator